MTEARRIVYDLDGTLFGGRDGWPIESRLAAVRTAVESGAAVSFLSGREAERLDHTLSELRKHISPSIQPGQVHLVGFLGNAKCAEAKAAVLRRMAPAPHLYVGDRMFDAAAAAQAGIPFCFVRPHFGEEPQ